MAAEGPIPEVESSAPGPMVMRVLLLLLACAASLTAHSQPPRDLRPSAPSSATAELRGRVLAADTGQPLAMVRMRLSTVKPGATPDHYARTDAEGYYEFRDVAPGPVHITASKAGYVTLEHGQALPATSGRPIELNPGAVLERIDFALPRASAITGRVVDDIGEPVERAAVSALRMRFVNGRRQLAQVAMASTNDNGEYRIPALQPGSYYVVAAERSAGFGARMDADIGFARTAYPAAMTLDGARPVDVRAGLDTQGVDIGLMPARIATVTGIVLNRAGQPAWNASVVLQSVGVGPGAGLGGELRAAADGRFEFPRVLAGRYELHVRSSGGIREGAILPLVVSDDVELVVPMVSARMTGRVVPPEGATGPPSAVSIHIEPVTETNAFGAGFGGAPNGDWTFDFDYLLGPRVIRTPRLPDGWHLRGVYLDGHDVTDEVFTLTGNEVVKGLEIVLTTEAADVTGTIAGANGEPCGTCTAIAFAEDPQRWRHPSRFIYAGRPDQQHLFRLRGLPPEQYLIAAVEEVEDGEWLDPGFLDRLRSHAERIDLRAAGSATAALRVVRP
jgi:hypothetical protein